MSEYRCHCGGLRHKCDMERIAELEAQLEGIKATLRAEFESDDNEYGSGWWINGNDTIGRFLFDDTGEAE